MGRKDNNVPFFSVIIPAYNSEGYVTGAIRSVLSQIDADVEVLVVDDGSIDGTRDEVRSLNENASGALRLICQENTGPGSARNLGIEEAKGVYILFLDSDDRYAADSLKVLKRYLVESDFPNMAAFDFAPMRDGVVVPRAVVVQRDYPEEETLSSEAMLDRFYTKHFGYFSWCFAYRRDFLAQGPVRYPEDGRLLEDAVFLNKATRNTDFVALYHGEPLYLYTLRADSISYTANLDSINWARAAVVGIFQQAASEGLISCSEVSLSNLLYLRRLAKLGGHKELMVGLESDIRMVDEALTHKVRKHSKDHAKVLLMRCGVLDAIEGFVHMVKRNV